jgi:hypothetical protein
MPVTAAGGALALADDLVLSRMDYGAMMAIDTLEAIQASLHSPGKRLVWFDNAAHTPRLEEPTIPAGAPSASGSSSW